MKLYTKKQFKEALRKTLVLNEREVMGVAITEKPDEGDWFENICRDIFENLK